MAIHWVRRYLASTVRLTSVGGSGHHPKQGGGNLPGDLTYFYIEGGSLACECLSCTRVCIRTCACTCMNVWKLSRSLPHLCSWSLLRFKIAGQDPYSG